MNSIGTKDGLVEVGSTAQVLRNLFSSSRAQSRTECFKRNSNRTPNGLKWALDLDCVAAIELAQSTQRVDSSS